jgi:transcriptional regulator with XRE-family HTH domain
MSYFPLTRFEDHLREDRKRAGLTQEELAQKVDASDIRMSASYLSKMETGLLKPPSRKAAAGLADALGMSKRPVTLYVSIKDIDALRRFAFFLEAYVAGAEDVQEIRLVEVEDRQRKREEGQPSATPLPTMADSAVQVGDTLLGTTGQHIDRLIASGGFSIEEEDEVAAALIEMTKRFLAFKEAKRQMEGEE